jgi:hypothetical protein
MKAQLSASSRVFDQHRQAPAGQPGTREICRAANALRFAPVRSSGSSMPCRERAVNWKWERERTGDRGRGSVRPGAHRPLTRTVLIPANRPKLDNRAYTWRV